jgi:hypothetical protein
MREEKNTGARRSGGRQDSWNNENISVGVGQWTETSQWLNVAGGLRATRLNDVRMLERGERRDEILREYRLNLFPGKKGKECPEATTAERGSE